MNRYRIFVVCLVLLGFHIVLAQDNPGVKLTPSEQDLFFAGLGFEISDSYAFIQGLTKTHVFRREGENWVRHQLIEHNAKNNSLSVSWGPLDLSGNNLLYSATDASNAIYTTLDFTMGEATGYKFIFPPIADDPSQQFFLDPRLQLFSRLDGKNAMVPALFFENATEFSFPFLFYREIGDFWVVDDILNLEEINTEGATRMTTSLSQDWAIIGTGSDVEYKLRFLKRENEQWHLKQILERPNAILQALSFHKSNAAVRTTSSVIIYRLNNDEWQEEFTYETPNSTGDIDIRNNILLDSNSGSNGGAILLRRTSTTTGDIRWQEIAEFLPVPEVTSESVSLSDNYALVSIVGSPSGPAAYVYKVPSNPTSVEPGNLDNTNKVTATPESFTLNQNHPNPFNASTIITYVLKKESHVRLTIYNSNGQMVSGLVNQTQFAGEYKVNWSDVEQDRKTVPSGIYFYELRVGANGRAVKKMLLLK